MKHKIEIIMLSTGYADIAIGDICSKGDRLYLAASELDCKRLANIIQVEECNYIYVTVPQDVEPINIGDSGYFISLDFDIPGVVKIDSVDKEDLEHIDYKIIATTNTSLTIKTTREEKIVNPSVYEKPLPQVQQSFIKEYFSNPNQKWEVEYEADWNDLQYNKFGEYAPYKLKLNQDNTVNITAVEEKMYSRSEVGKLLIKHQSDYRSHVRQTNDWSMDIATWIKDNL